MTCAYFVSSLWSALVLRKLGENNVSMTLVKITWALYAIAFPIEVAIIPFYWALVFTGGITYDEIMLHGVGALLIFFDAIVINRIPLRMKQFVFYEAFSLLYTLWTLVFTHSDLTNPYQEAGEMDDDAIYTSMRWKTNTTQVIVFVVILLLVVNPVVFLLCRWVSRIMPKRLIVVEENVDDAEHEKAEVDSCTSEEV